MKNKILIKLVVTMFLSLLTLTVSTILLISYMMTESTKDRIQDVVIIMQEQIETVNVEAIEEAIPLSLVNNNDIRLSVFYLNGDVIYDTWYPANQMENHANRKELIAAINGEPIFVTRLSTTVDEQLMYYAIKIENLSVNEQFIVLRVAIVVNSITNYVNFAILILIVVFLIIAFISYIYLNRVSNSFFEPLRKLKENLKNINRGKYETIPIEVFDDELVPIFEEINIISKSIIENLDKLSNEKEKISYIIDNLSQGLLLINDKLEIVLINNFAQKVFDIDSEVLNKNLLYLTQNSKIIQAVQDSIINNTSRVFDYEEIQKNNHTISISVSPIKGKWIASNNGVASIVILTDVTEIKDRERIRSEFFANASHELNTPLTYIVGYSELIANGIIEDNDKIKEISKKIFDESNRMKELVLDMLSLSKIESDIDIFYEDIDLIDITSKIISNLKIQADLKHINLSLKGKHVLLYSNIEMIEQLLINILDNAIKYNKDGGKVDVVIDDYSDSVQIKVIDTGIGIPVEDQSRVFERFYRVDKTRSKKIGGTGLGLAIVKHIALKLNAELKLESEVNKGTTISIIFYKYNKEV